MAIQRSSGESCGCSDLRGGSDLGDFLGIYQRQVTLPQAKRSSEKGKGISTAGADLGCPGMSGFSTEALAGIVLDIRIQR